MLIKKIVHLADIHIRTYRHHDEYEEVFENLYTKCKELTKDYDYDEVRIVIVGDVLHQKITISNESLLVTSKFFNKLSEIAPLVVVAGNHDLLENNIERMDSITPVIELLNSDKINYYKGKECYLDNNIVWCNYSIFEHNERPDIESARAEYGDDKTYVGLFHAPIIGAKTDLGYTFDTGTRVDFFSGCDFVLLGDIHKRQDLEFDIPVTYSGSLIQQDFGESVSNHGFLLWDVESRTYEGFEVENPYKYYLFEVNSIDDVDDNEEVLKNA
jgi:DNA repair exonuclease SbcCD nuclease subunit